MFFIISRTLQRCRCSPLLLNASSMQLWPILGVSDFTDWTTAVRLFAEISVKPSVSNPNSSLRLLRVRSEIPSISFSNASPNFLRKNSSWSFIISKRRRPFSPLPLTGHWYSKEQALSVFKPSSLVKRLVRTVSNILFLMQHKEHYLQDKDIHYLQHCLHYNITYTTLLSVQYFYRQQYFHYF